MRFYYAPRKKYILIRKICCFKHCLRHCLVVLCHLETLLSSVFKAQVADEIHSAFRSLSSAINPSTGEYQLESTNQLFGEQTERFRKVSDIFTYCFSRSQSCNDLSFKVVPQTTTISAVLSL